MTRDTEQTSRVLKSGGLQIGFHWHLDRYAHTIGLNVDGRFIPVLASMEGNGDEPWPASPPLQTLDSETPADREIAMLVGMAGRSHWSVAVELSAQPNVLTFDVACRLKDERPIILPSDQAGSALQSAYRTMVEPELVPDAPGQLLIGDVIVVANEGAAIRIHPNGIAIEAIDGSDELPRTVRWQYTVMAKPV